MEYALTDQDDMSADVPLAAASVSDLEICRRFEVVCEENFQRRSNWLLLLILGALVPSSHRGHMPTAWPSARRSLPAHQPCSVRWIA